jgi:hypothetical protein
MSATPLLIAPGPLPPKSRLSPGGVHRHPGRERPVRVHHYRLAEGADAIADSLDPGHRRAAAGERAQQQPQARGLGRRGQGGGRDHRLGVAAARHGPVDPNRKQQEEAGDEEVGCVGAVARMKREA